MKKIAFAVFLCSILIYIPYSSFAKFDPSFTWNTLQTPHFSIHYHQEEEEIAKKVAVIAEDIHDRLVQRIKWEPRQKTQLVLVDSMDEANGMASPIPYNQVIIFLTQPLGQPGFGTIHTTIGSAWSLPTSTRTSFSSTWCMAFPKLFRIFLGGYISRTCFNQYG